MRWVSLPILEAGQEASYAMATRVEVVMLLSTYVGEHRQRRRLRSVRWRKMGKRGAEDVSKVVWDTEASEVVQEAPRKNLVAVPTP